MKNLIYCLAFLCVSFSFAQSKPFKITGNLIAEDDQSPLEAATIYMQRVKDSSLVTYTISDKNGNFQLEDKTSDSDLNLFISYVGYKTYLQNIKIDKQEIALGTIPLETNSSNLGEVLIRSTAPVTIKKDTLEFNVKSFKTKKDATVEELLKQLPGVEVDEQGKITINGKEVNKILVNGKPFFGDDPTITTKNLTKDIIEKIQIVDTKSKSEAFTGEKGDQENKTINLTIKEENNKGVFGRVAAGAGTDKRYEFAGMLNRFDNDQRISVLAGGNNTNSPGFSFGEISKMFGRGRSSFNSNGSFSIDGRSFGGGEGITTSKNVGANYADKIGEKLDLSGDYFYSGSSSENESSSQRETILTDSRFFSNSSSNSENDTDAHSANMEFDIEIDSTFVINIEPSFRYSKTTTRFNSNEETLDSDLNLTNQSAVNSSVENNGQNFSNELSMTKKFGTAGAFLRFNIDNEIGKTQSDDFLNSSTEVFGTSPEIIERNQFTDGENKSNVFESSIKYRLPIISKKLFLDFEYSYRNEKDENRQSTFDFDDGDNLFNQFNTQLSTDFEYTNITKTPALDLRYNSEKLNLAFGVDYVYRTLENNDLLRPEFNVERDFEALQLSSYFNYRFSKKASMYANYRLRNRPPALRQLQAFEDVSNPLNTIIGNPNLEPTNSHNVYVGYNSYDFQKRAGFFLYGNLTADNNVVVSKTTIDPETLKRTTTYANVDGNYNAGIGTSYSKNIKLDSIRKLRIRAGVWSNFSKNINFNNEVQYNSKVTSLSPNLGLEFTWNKVFDFKPRYSVNFTNNSYGIEAFEDRNFMSHNLSLTTTTYLPKRFEWNNDIRYNYNPNIADGFQKSAWFWNASVAYSMLNDKAAVTLKVYDLLNQNTNARRTATQDFIEDSQSTVLQQYFMLSFSWKFNSLGAKGETGNNGMYYID
ncbi:outer membrane beta-barrel protein [Lacinutrix salivirga]